MFLCLLDHVYEAQRWSEKSLTLGRFGTQYVAMVTKLFTLNCGALLVESYCKESNISDANWLRYLFSSYLIKFGYLANLHFKNLNISETKTDI